MKRIDRVAQRISGNEIITAIRQGLLYMMPLVLIGSFILMILNLPIQAFQNGMDVIFKSHWRDVSLGVYNGTFQVMALTALMTISYSLAQVKKPVKSGDVNVLFVVLTAFASYYAFQYAEGEGPLPASAASSTGLFAAIIVAITSTYALLFFYERLPIKMRMYSYDSDSILERSLRMILPCFLTVFLFSLVRLLINTTGLGGITDGMYQGIQNAFAASGGTLFSSILYTIIIHVMWFFGLHGTNILDGVAEDLFVAASEVNIELAAAGMAPVNVVTKEFLDAFVYMGGSGATLGLMVALLLTGRNSNTSRIARFSFLPAIFNINEMMVYGLPIIFNPYYVIPFLLSPVALCITTFSAMHFGLVPLTTQRVLWTTPVLMSGYVSTGSFAGVMLQVVNLAISVLIYIPFIRLYEKNQREKNIAVFEQLKKEIFSDDPLNRRQFLNRDDDVGVLARALVSELHDCLYEGRNALHLEYQPKVNYQGKAVGAEALLRWEHPVHGYVSPVIVITLCEEAELDSKIGEWILRTAFQAQKSWTDQGFTDLKLSANLSPHQLKVDGDIVELMSGIVKETKLDPALMEVELTENAAVDQSASTRYKLKQIKDLGINISIDDFGMGNSSLLYLRDLYANVVKIDISLVRSITTDRNSQGIVHSIVQLCNDLNVGLIAEGVETKEQMEKLHELGCDQYQGFYFSKSLRFDDYLQFVKDHRR